MEDRTRALRESEPGSTAQGSPPWRANRWAESGSIVVVALTAALATALLQLAVRGGRVLLFSRLEVISPDAIWMAPVAEAAFFILVSLPFVALMLIRPSRRVTLVAVFVFGTLAFFFAALQTRWMYQSACLVLGIGVGWRLAAYWRRKPERALRIARGMAVSLATMFLAGSGVELFLTSDRGPSAPVSDPDAPNVLLLVLDTVGARHLSLYGYHRETSPHLSRIASEGATFDNAIAPSSWTLPSHASLFTGVSASQLTARLGVALDASHPTLAERFAERGYRTAGFTANFTYTGQSTGLSRGFQFYRGELRTVESLARHASFVRTQFFRRLRESPRALLRRRPDFTMPWEPPKEAKRGAMVVQEFLDWQASAGDRPFFAFLNLFDAHYPYQPAPPYATRFAQKPREVDRYDGGVAYMDDQLDVLVDRLRERQLLEKTILVILGDHGEGFGEHGLNSHGNSLYRELVHVPLVVRYPAGVPAGERIGSAVSLTDIAATLLEMADPRSPNTLPGSSMSRLWRGGAPSSPNAFSWLESAGRRDGPVWQPEHVSVTNDRYVLIARDDGRRELFEWQTDPDERVNLADSVRVASVRASLEALLAPMTRTWTPVSPRGAPGR